MPESPQNLSHGRRLPVTGLDAPLPSQTGGGMLFAAVGAMQLPMLVTDPHRPDNPIVFANDAFVKLTGYSSDEVLGHNVRFLQGPETDPGTIAEMRRAMDEHRDFSTEILNYRKDGSSFWNALFIAPVRDEAGDPVYFCASQVDVSRRRDAEQALLMAQKMEALGQLTGGIAHDFNNLLQVISGYADILQSQVDTGQLELGRLGRATEAIRTASDQAAKLTRQLLAFSRKQQAVGRAISLNGLVEGMGEMARRTLGGHVEWRAILAPGLWNARLDPTKAEVALLNVLMNARDAMPDGGRVTVETRNLVLDDRMIAAQQGLRTGEYVEVSVTDTGSGMAPEVLAHVTEPFFTTKEDGTGLGLATVSGFAKQSGGTLRITSRPGEGTQVRLVFPATQAEIAIGALGTGGNEEQNGTETILVVDERPAVAETTRTILADFGYQVHVSHRPHDALAILDDDARIDLLVSSFAMSGGTSGIALARAARERQPRIKVLLTTSFATAALEAPESDAAQFEVIRKPYRRMDLVRTVRRILDGSAGIG